jgi:hypothetical protein
MAIIDLKGGTLGLRLDPVVHYHRDIEFIIEVSR